MGGFAEAGRHAAVADAHPQAETFEANAGTAVGHVGLELADFAEKAGDAFHAEIGGLVVAGGDVAGRGENSGKMIGGDLGDGGMKRGFQGGQGGGINGGGGRRFGRGGQGIALLAEGIAEVLHLADALVEGLDDLGFQAVGGIALVGADEVGDDAHFRVGLGGAVFFADVEDLVLIGDGTGAGEIAGAFHGVVGAIVFLRGGLLLLADGVGGLVGIGDGDGGFGLAGIQQRLERGIGGSAGLVEFLGSLQLIINAGLVEGGSGDGGMILEISGEAGLEPATR